jgi:hypothetical protein
MRDCDGKENARAKTAAGGSAMSLSRTAQLSLVKNPDPDTNEQPSVDELRWNLSEQTEEIAAFSMNPKADGEEVTFKGFEEALHPKVMALARTAIMLFLTSAESRVAKGLPRQLERDGRRFRRGQPQARNLATRFGVVRYWRTYMREVTDKARRGFHPLDVALGLTADRISMWLLAMAVRLATKMSFEDARSTLGLFVPAAPSTEVIEQATLGFGRHTAEWFENAPAPEDDGEVLIIMIDSKAAPTATKQELKRRRGKRRKRSPVGSPRHRGRKRRKRYARKPRRKKGDKSKNGKMATLVVMYTLRRQGKYLVGPINRWIYASFAPKKHAFQIAKREAKKRGFGPDSGKTIQLVTDGDNDLARYAKDFFPEAIHTVDVMHVIEKLWSAGECIHREGSKDLSAWFEKQKKRLYGGKVHLILRNLRRHLDATPKTGPGNKGKRQRLHDVLRYLEKRTTMMNYDELIAEDLEIGSGPVEGAVKYVIGRRCDHGGMRWIKERAEAVLQLRCIEVNGDWDRFIQRVHDATRKRAIERGERVRVQQRKPAPLPEITEQAA